MQAADVRLETPEREVEVDGPGDVDDQRTFAFQQREGGGIEAEGGVIEIVALEREDLVLVLLRDVEIAGREGGEDALQGIGAAHGAVNFRDGGVREHLREDVGAY